MRIVIGLFLVLVFTVASCVGAVVKPCTQGGEAATEAALGGTKKCTQRKNTAGQWVNDGKYLEWHPNGLRAMEGEYRLGKKDGKWMHWDRDGKVLIERFFEYGVEVPRRDPAPSVVAPSQAPGLQPSDPR